MSSTQSFGEAVMAELAEAKEQAGLLKLTSADCAAIIDRALERYLHDLKTGNVSRKRDLAFEALAEVCDLRLSEITTPQRGAMNRALMVIRSVMPSVTAEEVRERAKVYRVKFRDAALTPSAIAKNWAGLGKPQDRHRAAMADEPQGWREYIRSTYPTDNESVTRTRYEDGPWASVPAWLRQEIHEHGRKEVA